MQTDELIQTLAAEGGSRKRLRPPSQRLVIWLAWSAPWIIGIIFLAGLRPDLADRLSEGSWLFSQAAALATALMAGFAAFCTIIPGRPRWEKFLPLVPLSLWLGFLGADCLAKWLAYRAEGLAIQPDWECFPAIVVTGLMPALVISVMIRRGAPLMPGGTVAFAALAAAALAAFGLRFFHMQDASIMVLIWQVGSVIVLTALGGLAAPLILRWRHRLAAPNFN